MVIFRAALLSVFFLQSPSESPGERYIALRTAAMQAGATAAEVERVLALFTDDSSYEHPAFKMRIEGIEAMRKGRLAQLGSTRDTSVTVQGRTRIDSAEAITEVLTFEARTKDGWRRVTRTQLLVFEYKDGRIVRLIEYWQQPVGPGGPTPNS